MSENFGFCFGHEDIVFDAYSAEVGDVDAGFYGHDHSGSHDGLRACGHSAGIVDVEAEPVSKTVAKVLGEVFFGEDFASVGVDGFAGGSVFEELAAFDFGLEDLVVDCLVAFGRFADDEGAGDVGAVAFQATAAVDGDEVAGLEFSFAGFAVRFCGVWTGDDDGVEGDFSAVPAIEEFHLKVDVVFGDSDLESRFDVLHAGVGEAAGLFDASDFGVGFDHTEVGDEGSVGRDPLDIGKLFFPGVPSRVGDGGFEGDLFEVVFV